MQESAQSKTYRKPAAQQEIRSYKTYLFIHLTSPLLCPNQMGNSQSTSNHKLACSEVITTGRWIIALQWHPKSGTYKYHRGDKLDITNSPIPIPLVQEMSRCDFELGRDVFAALNQKEMVRLKRSYEEWHFAGKIEKGMTGRYPVREDGKMKDVTLVVVEIRKKCNCRGREHRTPPDRDRQEEGTGGQPANGDGIAEVRRLVDVTKVNGTGRQTRDPPPQYTT
ncbi:hypothetical protein V1517DRAFT_87105 [Lipomyces orientalis]|uniref:Uncharacterized protein n=1 Tax=Lipomyces orientalis TaxID=1233043 RepID=A0ACC3TSS1_9ASCO